MVSAHRGQCAGMLLGALAASLGCGRILHRWRTLICAMPGAAASRSGALACLGVHFVDGSTAPMVRHGIARPVASLCLPRAHELALKCAAEVRSAIMSGHLSVLPDAATASAARRCSTRTCTRRSLCEAGHTGIAGRSKRSLGARCSDLSNSVSRRCGTKSDLSLRSDPDRSRRSYVRSSDNRSATRPSSPRRRQGCGRSHTATGRMRGRQ